MPARRQGHASCVLCGKTRAPGAGLAVMLQRAAFLLDVAGRLEKELGAIWQKRETPEMIP